MRVRITDGSGTQLVVCYPSLDAALGAVLGTCIHDHGIAAVHVDAHPLSPTGLPSYFFFSKDQGCAEAPVKTLEVLHA